jgi:hypothetical protein
MGLFKALKETKNLVSSSNGVGADAYVGRALVLDASLAGMAIQMGAEQYRVVNMRLQVFLDGNPAYIAECKQKVEEWRLGQLVGQAYAVRVARDNGQQVALDFSMEAPVVTLPRPADGGAAALLASGTPAEAVIIASQPLGLRNWDGSDVVLFQLTVMPAGGAPYQVQVGNPCPASALPFVYPGSRVPVKLGSTPQDVAIDWSLAAQPR